MDFTAKRRTRELVMFVPDVTDATTSKRCESFLDRGYALTVFGFRRERYNRDFRPTWTFVGLGHTRDGRYLQRVFALIRALPILFAHRRGLANSAIFHARNIDQLLLALAARAMAGCQPDIVYEVLDVQPAFVGRGWKARFLRAVERLCLPRVDLLVVSSPGFVRNFYRPIQNYRGRWFLLENKLAPSIADSIGDRPLPVDTAPERHGYRWVVMYCGLIRGDATLDLITRLAERLRGLVLFKFRGILTTVSRQQFDAALARHPNIVYEGEYVSPRDLRDVYAGADFAWAIDLENATNSRWLLPCRFYEAGLFGIPCLAGRGFEVGNMVDGLGIGWTFEAPFEDQIVDFLRKLDPAAYRDALRRLRTLPVSRFVAGDDVAALCDLMDSSSVAAPAGLSRKAA